MTKKRKLTINVQQLRSVHYKKREPALDLMRVLSSLEKISNYLSPKYSFIEKCQDLYHQFNGEFTWRFQ